MLITLFTTIKALYLPVSLLKLSDQWHGIYIQCIIILFCSCRQKCVWECQWKQIVAQKREQSVPDQWIQFNLDYKIYKLNKLTVSVSLSIRCNLKESCDLHWLVHDHYLKITSAIKLPLHCTFHSFFLHYILFLWLSCFFKYICTKTVLCKWHIQAWRHM